MINTISRRTAWLMLSLISLVWFFLLVPNSTYGGQNHSDFTFHEQLVLRILDAFREGSLGLDVWEDRYGLGNAPFRTYQNLAHYLAAVLMHLFRLAHPTRALFILTSLAVVLQIPVFYRAARLIGLSRETGLAAAWLAPLLVSNLSMGHEMESYLYSGMTLYTQAVAFPPFVLALAWCARVSGWVPEVGPATPRERVIVGFWIGLSFLLHHIFGYFTVLAFGAMMAVGLVTRWVKWRSGLETILVTAVVFVLLSAYQILSLVQDGSLVMIGSFFESPDRWDGLGIGLALQNVLAGDLLDFSRFPSITILAFTGMIVAASLRGTRGQRVIFLWGAAALFLLSGRTSYGTRFDWIPGFRQLMLIRAGTFLQVALVFLAAIGAGGLWQIIANHSKWLVGRERAAARWLAGLTLFLLGGAPFLNRLAYVRINNQDRVAQEKANAAFDYQVFSSVESEMRHGNFWIPRNDPKASPENPYQNIPLVGRLYVANFLSYYDLPQIADTSHHMNFSSEAIRLFKPKRKYHYRLFNVSAVLLKSSVPAPEFLTKAYDNGEFATYRAPSEGMFDVVAVPEVKSVAPGDSYLEALIPWLLGTEAENGQYPAIIPEQISQRWPESIPRVAPGAKAVSNGWPWGTVESWERVAGGDYRAVLEKRQPEALGLLRTGYHPSWNILVNGTPAIPRWLGPGFLGFDLKPGRNVVEVRFPTDPKRVYLFWLSLLTLSTGLAAVLAPLLALPLVTEWRMQAKRA